jgi:chitin disaccharide deacetylase
MPARLIINADDFGLTPGINRAIAELHDAHVLTSTTLMPTGPAFADAVALARARPTLGVGCHITLTDGIPVSHPEDIPSLLGADGKTFRPSFLDLIQALLRGTVNQDELIRECFAQVQKLQRAGIDVTHLDSHKHTHIFPPVTRALLHVAERCSIGAIRNAFEQPWSLNLPLARRIGRIRRLQVKLLGELRHRFNAQPQLLSGRILTTDATIGISATGNLTPATLAEILHALPPTGTFELVTHPGYNSPDLDRIPTRLRASRNIERQALLTELPRFLTSFNRPESVSELIGPTAPAQAPELIHFGNLGIPGHQRALGHFTPNTGYEPTL